jgi:rod shape-determining protein MreC
MSATRKRLFLALALLLLSIGLLLLGLAGMLSPVQDLAFRAVGGLQGNISTAFFNFRDFLTAPRNLQDLLLRNAELESQVARLEAEVVTLREQASEVEVLRALLGAAREQPESHYLVAHVIGRDTSPFLNYLILDQGSDSGIRRGMPVISQNGLVGRISEVSSTASKVELIVDPESAINARIQESRSEGVLVGQSSGELQLTYLSQDASVKPGDIVVTSGLGGSFPAEILIGRVVSVHRRDYEFYQTAVIEPRNDFSRLELLLVITNFTPIEIAPLEGVAP